MMKPVLFYSPQCQHSKQVLDAIIKTNLRPTMVLIDISKVSQTRLPKNLTKVPAIWNPAKRDILYEAQLLDFLKQAIAANHQSKPPPATSNPTSNRELMPANMGNFAYLNEDEQTVTGDFSFVNAPIERIETPEADPMPGSNQQPIAPKKVITDEPRIGEYTAPDSRVSAMSLEDLQALRDADCQAWMAKK